VDELSADPTGRGSLLLEPPDVVVSHLLPLY
jgi:hypothetical protein